MGKVYQNGVKITTLIMLLLIGMTFAVIGGYLINRGIHTANNDLLLTYTLLELVAYSEEVVDGIKYKDYHLGEERGRVIVSNDGEHITVRDNQHGFIKDYRYGVLYMIMDFEKEELFAQAKSYLNPRFWLSGSQIVSISATSFKRSHEECEEIGKLLKDQLYDKIKANKKNELIRSQEGIYFVN